MECGDLSRTGVAGLDRAFVINIDHHPGNTDFGQINWFDASAAACAEMVFDLVRALGVPLSLDMATHLYLAIVTDTGSFHYSSISPRTFDICRQLLEAGVDPVRLSRQVFDSKHHRPPQDVRRRDAGHGARPDQTDRPAVPRRARSRPPLEATTTTRTG